MDKITKQLFKEGKITQKLLQDIICKAKQEKAKEIFEDMESIYKKCENSDIRGIVLSDINELKKHHLEGEEK